MYYSGVRPTSALDAVPSRKFSRREQILERASDLFAREGYQSTSLMDLANAADIAKATLFHYFTTKEQILFELYTQAMELALATIRSVPPADDPAVELQGMLQRHALLIMNNQSLFSVFFAEENGLESDHLASVHRQQAEYLNFVAERIIALQRTKRVSKKIHPRVAAQSMLGIGSWTYKWYENDKAMSAREIADFVAGIALRGLLIRDN
jgi:TetR/AcrR family transcriptional regulator, cholesterol catabolism regulator